MNPTVSIAYCLEKNFRLWIKEGDQKLHTDLLELSGWRQEYGESKIVGLCRI
jgi:hypothetical protein